MFSDVEVSVFMEELDEKIQVISDNLLVMEKGGDSPEVIQEIFRAAHTIKGSSAVMGYEHMTALTHEIENLFECLRQETLSITPELIDTLFEALDTLHDLRQEITGEGEAVDTTFVVSRIKEFTCDIQDSAPGVHLPGTADTQAPVLPPLEDVDELLIQEAELKGFQAYWVTVALTPGVQMKEVRAYMVFEALQQIGEVVKSSPPAEDLEKGKFEQYFVVILLTKEDPDRVRNSVLSIAEIEDARVEQVQLTDDQPAALSNNVKKQEVKTAAGLDPANKKKVTVSKTVRVDVQKLDTLMNLVGELVIDRTRLNRFAEIFESHYGSDELAENILEISTHLGQVTTDLQDEIMKARMLPVSYVFNRLPRMVRDMVHKINKKVDFIIEGKETELDRNVIEVIGDPLIHLLRNAIDHGIETPDERIEAGKPATGKLILKASYVESHIVITLEDDGRGMDAEKLRQKIVEKELVTAEQAKRMGSGEVLDYIFAPGFSTTENISDISGRGVGMDIVRSQIEQINGSVEFNTVLGQGTTFTIKLPLTLAIIRALMVNLGEHAYAFPLTHIVETLSIPSDEINLVRHTEVVVVRGAVLPLVRLSNIFNQESNVEDSSRLYVVVLGAGDKKVGVIVDRLLGEQEIVIKSLGAYLGQVVNISGATILGDGKVALIVDALGIIKESGTCLEDAFYAAAN